ncbi:MAG: SGNH/GDSL hydrolase family protein, partial [Armatimonadetes bacterium]|nr:SGNH/GDSL hydrolase family protein [Armatimonadota bacterium]
ALFFFAACSTYLTLLLLAIVLPGILPAAWFERVQAIGMPADLSVADPVLGYRFRPHYRGEFEGKQHERVALSTNAAGWRDEEFGPPGVGRPRLMVLGDSITMGVGVPAEERFSERLEVLRPGLVADNCAASGYELNQLLELSREMLPRLRPQVVLYAVCLNDIRTADIGGLQDIEQRNRQRSGRALLELRPLGRFIDNLRLRREAGRPSRTPMRPAEAGAMRRWEDPAERAHFQARLTELRGLCLDAGARLAVVVFPYTFQFEALPGSDLLRPQQYLGAMLGALRLPWFDLLPTMAAASRAVYLPGDNCHPNSLGNGLAAEAIATWLSAEGLLTANSDKPSH